MKSKKKTIQKKVYKNTLMKVISVILVIFGGLALIAAAVIFFMGIRESNSSFYQFAGLCLIPAVPCLLMGISEIVSMRNHKQNFVGFVTGIVTLIALILFIIIAVTKLTSSGVEFVYLVVVLCSPAFILTILYIKSLMKKFGQT